jgi:zinc transporter ZupT
VYPVCPSCSHSHDHDSCSTRLHGFATPLIVATVIHSAFDGWALTAAATSEFVHVGYAFSLGMWVHKLPESIAVGVIVKAALRSKRKALIWAVLVQFAVI